MVLTLLSIIGNLKGQSCNLAVNRTISRRCRICPIQRLRILNLCAEHLPRNQSRIANTEQRKIRIICNLNSHGYKPRVIRNADINRNG